MALVHYASDSDGDPDQDEIAPVTVTVVPPLASPVNISSSATPVNYISSSDSNNSAAKDGTSDGQPVKKRLKLDNGPPPPLPAAFHDLYASTVRTSTSDDPSLHQGRVRQIPHKVGNWPSHVYIEWHPPHETFSLLEKCISTLQSKMKDKDITITSFLTSDLGVPLPLHISLSRPLSLTTANKDEFLNELLSTIRASNIHPFDLSLRGVDWHRTEESGRSFLVLRLQSASSTTESEEDNRNPELTELLKRCNQLAREYNQPGLYEWACSDKLPSLRPSPPHNAFHISIAWSFSPPDDDLIEATKQAFGSAFTSNTTWRKEDDEENEQQFTEAQALSPVQVEAVKVKIGNVVTSVPLLRPGDRLKGRGARHTLLGLT
ncbi:putative conserved domain containing protein [Naviculisporaceae sp. PSN 640]